MTAPNWDGSSWSPTSCSIQSQTEELQLLSVCQHRGQGHGTQIFFYHPGRVRLGDRNNRRASPHHWHSRLSDAAVEDGTHGGCQQWGEVMEQPSGNPVWAGTLPGVQPCKPLLHLLNGDDVLVRDVVGAGSVVAVLQGSEVSIHRVQELVDCVAKVLCAAAADTVHHALQPRCLAANSSHLPDTPPPGPAAASQATDLAGEVVLPQALAHPVGLVPQILV